MPELPEVETVARQLAPRIVGRGLRRLRIFDRKLEPSRCPGLTRRRVTSVHRLGKQVVIEASERDLLLPPAYLVVHLRMTGRLVWSPARRAEHPERARAALDLDGGSVWFLDLRRFGTLRWVRDLAAAQPAGIDPLSPAASAEALGRLLRGSRQPLKTWLLRQDRLVGLGNIYASEILHRARLSPLREAGRLSPNEVARLQRATVAILERAIENCGTTFSDFQDARGELGAYQDYLEVYGRERKPCRRCGAPILRLVQHQRSTFYCASCQR